MSNQTGMRVVGRFRTIANKLVQICENAYS